MSASIVKSLNSLLTPVKSSRLNFVPPTYNLERESLSATSKQSVFTGYDFGSYSSVCTTLKNSPHSVSTKKRCALQHNAARCLFSPQRSSNIPIAKKLFSTPEYIRCQDQTLPSFDTPLRKAISSKEFCQISKSFILGRGSYGFVVKGRYKNKNIAVKILSRSQEEVLNNEMNALKLEHPNIIKVNKVVFEPDKNIGFVFMELYSKTNLEHVLQCGLVDESEKMRYLKQIGKALQYCHSNDILHLDVKPKNIIVNTHDTTCKLCDFGNSIVKSNIKRTDNHGRGTLKYTAPELLKGDNPTEKSDVYSFGITMWQTIHQEVPYDGEELQEVVYKVVKHNYRPVSCKVVHDTIRNIYKACWQADPQQRPSITHVLVMVDTIFPDKGGFNKTGLQL